jgi:diguanylate cyclase (GGDEF)-like protein
VVAGTVRVITSRRSVLKLVHQTQIQTLIETITLIPRDSEVDESWLGHVLNALAECLGAEAGLLLTTADDGSSWERLAVRPGPDRVVEHWRLPGPLGGLHAGIAAGDPAPDPDQGAHPQWDRVSGVPVRRLVGAPLEEGTTGVLSVWNPTRPDAPLVIAAAAAALAAALRNRILVRQLEGEVITDELTQVYNYRYLISALDREVTLAGRHSYRLALLMVDVDHLKEYNERFGHLAGSGVLKIVASVLQASVRSVDLVAKYGGDEFLIILPHTGRKGAHAAAERARRAVAETAFPQLAAGDMTCSIGVSVLPEDGTAPATLLASADTALFSAKRSGRNQVSSTPPRPRAA